MAEKTAAPVDPVAKARQDIEARFERYNGEADKVRDEHGYNGLLTPRLFLELEEFLRKPTPPVYVEHTPAKRNRQDDGLPYAVTGLKSQQFQIDRMNDVLGAMHWRQLLHYEQGGSLCKCVVVIGNHLHWCRLDEKGNLHPYTVVKPDEVKYADVIKVVEGWGGHTTKQAGNTYKGAETNATKRTLAKVGPGSDVYRVDYDEDTLRLLHGEEQQEPPIVPARRPPQGKNLGPRELYQQPPVLTPEQAAERLRDLCSWNDEQHHPDEIMLRQKRALARDIMNELPPNKRPDVRAQWKLIFDRRDDINQLEALIQRTRTALGGTSD